MTRLAFFCSLLLTACDCGGATTCLTASDCPIGAVCIDGTCAERRDGGGRDDGGADADRGDVSEEGDAGEDLGPCTVSGDCSEDARCIDGRCRPFGPGETDPECSRAILAGAFAPTVQCEFDEAPAGDAFPEHLHVLSTPMVVDFALERGPDDPARPSIVAVFDDGVDGTSEQPTGVIRILDGATCTQQAELGSLQLTSHSSPPAVGDLDGDGRAEIVAYQAGGGLVAFRHDGTAWAVFWRSTLPDGVTPYDLSGGGWAGPSIADLDDDGVPEVMRGTVVFDAAGHLLSDTLIESYSQGVFGVVADVDADGKIEQIQGTGVWEWSGTAWVLEAYAMGGTAAGHVALADFGDFPGTNAWPANTPEVVVVSAGEVRVQTLDGSTVFGPVVIPGGGTGGPPTVADFDGDGRPEFATAGATQYVVMDMDCVTPVGACASGRADGILWAQPSQDASSNVTGSSVFDFDGDGRAEAVYGDECFLRVYDGETGSVVFSQFRSSCTWYENPVVADVDGDFNAEIVIGNNFNCGLVSSGVGCGGLDPREVDPIHVGLGCAESTDCVSGSCVEGFCRCTADTECCAGAGCEEAGYVCETPPAGTPGVGNTCRASHPRGALGIRVYRDSADRWVRSRTIWNQHAYHVTNVGERGEIPRSSAAAINWTAPDLNNFRQNVQGDAIPGASPDLTARGTPIECSGGMATVTTRVCNRGTEPIGSGLSVGFYAAEVSDATLICRATTAGDLGPGACEEVSCIWADPPREEPGVDLIIVADDLAENTECHEGNNRSVVPGARCGVIG